MQAMILAAGFGTRLLPHSTIRPKPLFPILNKPLLLATVERLQRAGATRIVINCHHLQEQIVAAVSHLDRVQVQVEETILGTGGGLRTALSLFRDEPLLVTNGDIYHTIDLAALYRQHQRLACPVTLAMHDYPRFNSVPVRDGQAIGFQKGEADALLLAFTGLHVIEPAVLERLAPHRYSCIIELYRQLLKENKRLAISRCDGSFWTDMGTPADYLALHRGLLSQTIPCWQELAGNVEPCLVAPDADLDQGCCLEEWCAVGKVQARGVTITRSVVWDGATLEPGGVYRDVIVSS